MLGRAAKQTSVGCRGVEQRERDDLLKLFKQKDTSDVAVARVYGFKKLLFSLTLLVRAAQPPHDSRSKNNLLHSPTTLAS